MNLRALGEEELLRKILPHLPLNRSVISGPGDDCAVVKFDRRDNLLVLKTDCIVEGIHFHPKTKAVDVGWKAMARPLSDFAAMSARPQFALVTFIAPNETKVRWSEDVYRGLGKVARACDVAIVGGETSRTDGPVAISVSVTGVVEKNRWVSRAGGKSGDDLFVTGNLGGSLRGRHLRFTPRIEEARWLTKHFSIDAMMDLSDGLGADLPRLARASKVGFEVERNSIPRNRGCTIEQAISDGEDYELLFAISPNESKKLQRAWRKRFPNLRLTRMGKLTGKSKRNQKLPRGYDHFA
ncbi:MAG: thiamine-phosphate kinase [Verrucomicrobiota bacterium]|nr:thiamine-phosphate kinase [Verrucomicrobiota bacterium]MDQ6939845.1 thiamine-phosphate kinase [Verrucomicrobiota bacterium]